MGRRREGSKSLKAGLHWVGEHSSGGHQLVAQLGAALGLEQHDEAPGLPRRRLVQRELLVLVAPGAARLVAVEERDRVVGVGLDAPLATAHRPERDVRAGVGLVGREPLELRRALGAVPVGQPQTLRACKSGGSVLVLRWLGSVTEGVVRCDAYLDQRRVRVAADRLLDGGANRLPRRVAVVEHRCQLVVAQVVVDHPRAECVRNRGDSRKRWG